MIFSRERPEPRSGTHVTKPLFQRIGCRPGCGTYLRWPRLGLRAYALAPVVFSLLAPVLFRAQAPSSVTTPSKSGAKTISRQPGEPPRVTEARRFLAARGLKPGSLTVSGRGLTRRVRASSSGSTQTGTQTSPTWQPLGPTAVITSGYGLVTGRVSALALDPADSTGNHLYVGTTGGGVWEAQNAAVSNVSLIAFTPLTDAVGALGEVQDASISIGGLTVQPGGKGVVLAGTGDPNDLLDSYYGAGILRSTDGGNTWILVEATQDEEDGLSDQDYSFEGEGFAGFAWSTVNPQLVVAAVSQAYEGALVNATTSGRSCEGLYYSSDAGATWHLATITDGAGSDVQGPLDAFAEPDGNAATAVVWNPVRQVFIAAVRYHGYYQSSDGITWLRLSDSSQPGAELSAVNCPTNTGSTGSDYCPIFRGALAVNPQTGDTFAWTVDLNQQDQGLFQDLCGLSGGVCSNTTMTFGQQWATGALETSTSAGAATIVDGAYTLALAAVPSGQETAVLAGADDLWKSNCPVSQGCSWRNTTHAQTCMSAAVGAYEHALAWNAANPLEIFLGNDSGLWRSMDAIGETGSQCSSTDASHFQNLNGQFYDSYVSASENTPGSLAEVQSLSPVISTPYTMMAGLGVNGTAGVKGSAATADWPQILGGYGGPVAVDPLNGSNWYVNDQDGVSIYLCAQQSACAPSDFGSSPVVTDADVNLEPGVMGSPATFLVDPLDGSQLLIGTCQVWRGPADGIGWSQANAVSPILDTGSTAGACNSGDALIRSMAAIELAGGSEAIYVGMYGSGNGGLLLPGHVLTATLNPSSGAAAVWNDLTLNQVTNDNHTLNSYGLDISSITIDPHDLTGNTVYVTVEGINNVTENVQTLYRSTNGGASWTVMTANLPATPVSSIAVDPGNANVVYAATDAGVYFTTQIDSCPQAPANCWSVFGSGLPAAPAVALSASPASSAEQVLVAATYGRGIWQTPLWSASTSITAVIANPTVLNFGNQSFGSSSSPLTVELGDTGSLALNPTSISVTGDFSESDNCAGRSVGTGSSCAIQVTFTPSAMGARTGLMTIYANVYGGQITVDLNGTGTPAGAVSLQPGTLDFGQVEVNTTSATQTISVSNSTGSAIPLNGTQPIIVTPPFSIPANLNTCGTTSLAPKASCTIAVEFSPTTPGPASGTLSLNDGAGTQTAILSGTGEAAPTDVLNPTSLTFPLTAADSVSSAQTVSLTNIGGEPLELTSITASAGFESSNTCGGQLAGASICTISVVFAPTQAGNITGALTIADALRTQTISLSGTAAAPPTITVNPTSLTFAAQAPGSAPASQTISIANGGQFPMANMGFQITGDGAAAYSIGTTNCGALLNAGASCTAQVVFAPTELGTIAATLAVSSSTGGVKAVAVPINGAGQVANGLGANPSQVDFSGVIEGLSSTATPVTVTNSTGYPIESLTLTAGAPFVLPQNGCTGALAAGASCNALVEFQPTSTGAASGSLTISSAGLASPTFVLLAGTGQAMGVSPAPVAFSVVGVGLSATQSVTITNPSNYAMQSMSVVLAGSSSSQFTLTQNGCTGALAAGNNCTATVEFQPTSTGAATGSLTISSAGVAVPPSVSLTGTGFEFTLAPSGSTTQTVVSGQSASYTLVISPGGAQATFNFSCGTLPKNALCTFNPNGETVSNGVQGNVTVQVSTGQSLAKVDGPTAGWRVLPLFCGLLVVPFALRGRRGILLLAVAGILLATCISSCTSSGSLSSGSSGGSGSGGSGGQSGSSATPTGTYTIPVTVTDKATGLSQTCDANSATCDLTLVVD